ncbi:MAG: hypothetical protein GQ570_03935 [Helicobacteraceae bacterium]|nr:hypothetical protein [Helicobacteraceae bacterium]
MAKQLFSNNARTAVNAQFSVIATNLILGSGEDFTGPNPAFDEYELVTISSNGLYEIVKVLQRGDLIAQHSQATPSVPITGGVSTYYLDLTDEFGVVHTISYLSQSNTVAVVVAGLHTAWLAEVGSPWDAYTVNDNSSHLEVISTTAGVPFTLEARTTGNGSEIFTVITSIPAIAGQGNVSVVERAQEGTVARQWEIGSIISGRITAGTMSSVRDEIQATADDLIEYQSSAKDLFYDYGVQGADFTLDMSLAETIRVEVTANIQITLSGGSRGGASRLCLVQDSTGGWDVDLVNVTRWQDGAVPALVTLANKMDVVGILHMPIDGVSDVYVGMAYTVNL